MILYIIFTLLGLIGIGTVFIGAANEDDHHYLISVGLATLAISSLILGMLLGMEAYRTSKQPIKPSIKIECVDGKCDTTYIYEFKLEE
jgi:hypothetical protein